MNPTPSVYYHSCRSWLAYNSDEFFLWCQPPLKVTPPRAYELERVHDSLSCLLSQWCQHICCDLATSSHCHSSLAKLFDSDCLHLCWILHLSFLIQITPTQIHLLQPSTSSPVISWAVNLLKLPLTMNYIFCSVSLDQINWIPNSNFMFPFTTSPCGALVAITPPRADSREQQQLSTTSLTRPAASTSDVSLFPYEHNRTFLPWNLHLNRCGFRGFHRRVHLCISISLLFSTLTNSFLIVKVLMQSLHLLAYSSDADPLKSQVYF